MWGWRLRSLRRRHLHRCWRRKAPRRYPWLLWRFRHLWAIVGRSIIKRLRCSSWRWNARCDDSWCGCAWQRDWRYTWSTWRRHTGSASAQLALRNRACCGLQDHATCWALFACSTPRQSICRLCFGEEVICRSAANHRNARHTVVHRRCNLTRIWRRPIHGTGR